MQRLGAEEPTPDLSKTHIYTSLSRGRMLPFVSLDSAGIQRTGGTCMLGEKRDNGAMPESAGARVRGLRSNEAPSLFLLKALQLPESHFLYM